MLRLFEYGGPILWVQAFLGFYGFVIIIERIIYFQSTRTNIADMLLGLANLLRRQSYNEAKHEASRGRGPAARVAYSILLRHTLPRTNLREIAEEAVVLEVPRMERNLRSLLGVTLLAPLTGLLGTVLGLMDVFENLGGGGIISQARLAGGIYQSLVTTAIGLAISTCCYFFYLALLGKAQRLLGRLKATAIDVINLIHDTQERQSSQSSSQHPLAERALRISEERRKLREKEGSEKNVEAENSTP